MIGPQSIVEVCKNIAWEKARIISKKNNHSLPYYKLVLLNANKKSCLKTGVILSTRSPELQF